MKMEHGHYMIDLNCTLYGYYLIDIHKLFLGGVMKVVTSVTLFQNALQSLDERKIVLISIALK